MIKILLRMSDSEAWCCGFTNRKSNGDIVKTTRNFHLRSLGTRVEGQDQPRDPEQSTHVPVSQHPTRATDKLHFPSTVRK